MAAASGSCSPCATECPACSKCSLLANATLSHLLASETSGTSLFARAAPKLHQLLGRRLAQEYFKSLSKADRECALKCLPKTMALWDAALGTRSRGPLLEQVLMHIKCGNVEDGFKTTGTDYRHSLEHRGALGGSAPSLSRESRIGLCEVDGKFFSWETKGIVGGGRWRPYGADEKKKASKRMRDSWSAKSKAEKKASMQAQRTAYPLSKRGDPVNFVELKQHDKIIAITQVSGLVPTAQRVIAEVRQASRRTARALRVSPRHALS